METILLIITIGLTNLFCFIIGAKVGQKVVKGEPVELPNLNPVKAVNNAITEHKDNKEKQAEDEYIKALMYNIDHYDGTGAMQKELPRR